MMGYLLSKDQETTLAWFRDNTNVLVFVFLPHLTMHILLKQGSLFHGRPDSTVS